MIRVLLVDDDEEDYLITSEMLSEHAHVRFVVDWYAKYDEALVAILEHRHDVYLVDYRLGPRTGLELVREGFATRSFGPVIMLTGMVSYEVDLEASALGVTAFLAKQTLDPVTLERTIRYAISHRRAERYALAVSAANDGIWDWDLQTERVYLSPRGCAILGLPQPAGDTDLSVLLGLVHPDDLKQLQSAFEAHLDGATPQLEIEHRMRHADGSWRWVITRGLATREPGRVATRMAGSLSDLTDQRHAQLQLEHEALHDSLTGLPNRSLFLDRVTQFLERAIREPAKTCAVLFLDLDNFKHVNDSFSHAVGDRLLITLAQRIYAAVRPGDTVGRIGGDEFTVLLEDVVDVGEVRLIADRILHSIADPVDIDGNELFVGVSIGIALSASGLGPADLMRNADVAMYAAKQRGRGGSAMFDESMHRRLIDRRARETELRQAVEGSLLRVHYQPIVDLASGRIQGLEALARWPAGWATVDPMEFISIAEETGMIADLGHFVLRSALEMFALWRRAAFLADDVSISVNFSARQLSDPSLAEQLRMTIASAALPPQNLKLEITEGTLMQEIERAAQRFADVCGTGVGLHLDNFGIGYTSLTALHRLPFDAVKIDRSFVTRLSANDPDNEIVLRAAVALAHGLGLPVIAEGIETPEQLKRCRALDCDYGQGHLFSPALSADDTSVLLRDWRPATVVELANAA